MRSPVGKLRDSRTTSLLGRDFGAQDPGFGEQPRRAVRLPAETPRASRAPACPSLPRRDVAAECRPFSSPAAVILPRRDNVPPVLHNVLAWERNAHEKSPSGAPGLQSRDNIQKKRRKVSAWEKCSGQKRQLLPSREFMHKHGDPSPQQSQNKEGVDLLDHARRLGGGGETLESAQGLWGARDRERQARRSVLRHVRRVGAARSGAPEFLATPLKPHCQQTPRAPRLSGCPRLPRKRRALTFSVMPDD